MVNAAVAAKSPVPDLAEILDCRTEAALTEAFIKQCVTDRRPVLRAAITADCDNQQFDRLWIAREISFALGLEIGKRLVGGAR